MSFITHKGTEVYYTDQGRGPAVVLLHGFLEHSGMWDAYVEALRGRYRVICIDLPGHGRTTSMGYIHTMEDMAETVKAVLAHLRLRKYALIGHSMGGYVALALAEKFPDQIRGLGLFFSSAKEDDEAKKEMRGRAIEAVKYNHSTFVRTTIPGLFGETKRELYQEEIAALIKDALKMTKQGIIAALEGMRARPDREVLLHFGPYPVMIVSGKEDTRLPESEMQSQWNAPHVIHKLITENGHMGHIEDRDACLEVIFSFLKDIMSAKRS